MKPLLSLLPAALLICSSAQAQVIVDDTFADGVRDDWEPNESMWFHAKTPTTSTTPFYMGVEPGTLYMTNYIPTGPFWSGARYFWCYFTTNEPGMTVPQSETNMFSNTTNAYYGKQVEVTPGRMLKATFRFIPAGYLLPDSSGGVRFALLSYENHPDGRAPRDTANGTKSGTNVTGYRVQIPICENWTNNTLFSFHTRTNYNIGVDSGDPLGKASAWHSIGGSPSLTNVAAFQLNQEYTIEFSVSRYTDSNVIGCQLSGPLAGAAQTNFFRSYVDSSTSNYFKFDCFAVRVDGAVLAADEFRVKQFKVELLPLPGALPAAFEIQSAALTPAGGFVVTWASEPGFTYNVLSKQDLGAGWATNGTVTATGNSTSWTNSTSAGTRFFRVMGLPL